MTVVQAQRLQCQRVTCLQRLTCWLMLLTLCAQAPSAGDRLTPERLAQDADAVVRLTVVFHDSGADSRLDEVLWGGAPLITATALARLFGPCLPTTQLLEQWLVRYGEPADARALWQQALDDQGYQAVLVLRTWSGRLEPNCETEALDAEHWLAHPAHAHWRSRLESALAARAASRCIRPARV